MLTHIRPLRSLLALSLICGLALSARAQTTGVVGFNDFTIAGSFSSTASCQFQVLPAGPTTFNVNTAPGAPVVLLINLNCPCLPCFFSFGSTASACAIPSSACGGTSNQSLDLDISGTSGALCFFISVAMPPADAAGNSTLVIPLPPMVRFSTQALALHPCNASGPFPPVFSQAYDIAVP